MQKKLYSFQTHFVFTKLGSEVYCFWVIAISFAKKMVLVTLYDNVAFRHDNEELIVEPFEWEIHELLDSVDDMTIPKECENVDVHRDNGESLLEQFVLLIRDCQSKGLLRFQV